MLQTLNYYLFCLKNIIILKRIGIYYLILKLITNIDICIIWS